MLGIADPAGKEQAALDKFNQSSLDSIDKQTTAAEQQDQTLQDQIATFGMTKAASAQSAADSPKSPVSVQRIYRRVLEDLTPLAEAKHIDIGVEGLEDAEGLGERAGHDRRGQEPG